MTFADLVANDQYFSTPIRSSIISHRTRRSAQAPTS